MNRFALTYRFKKPSNPWLFSSAIIAIILLLCLVPIAINSFSQDDAWQHLTEYLLLDYAINSLNLLVGVGVGTFMFGVGSAYLVTRFNFYGRSIIEKLLVLPLAVPSYLLAYALSGFFDYTGPFRQFSLWLLGNFGSNFYVDIQHLFGLIVVISIALYPYVYLSAKTTFKNLFLTYSEVGLTLGLNKTSVWRRLILPMALPSIGASILLVFMECLNDYGASKYFGVNTLTTGVFRAWFSLNSIASASKIAFILLSIILLFIWLKQLLQGKRKFNTQLAQKSLKRKELNRLKGFLALSACSIPLIIGLVIPFVFMVYAWLFAQADINYIPYLELIKNTLILALTVGAFSVLISFLWQFSIYQFKSQLIERLSKLASIGYTIPGAVIGMGVIGLSAYITQATTLYLNNCLFVLVFGLIFRVLSVSNQNITLGFNQLPKHIDDLTTMMGISHIKNIKSIYTPLSKSFIGIGFLLVFIDVLKELPLTLILRPFNFDTLATKTYEYANDELLMEAFHVAPVIILISIIPVWMLNKSN